MVLCCDRVQLIWQRIKYIVQRKMHIDVRYDKIKKMDFFEGYIFVKVPNQPLCCVWFLCERIKVYLDFGFFEEILILLL